MTRSYLRAAILCFAICAAVVAWALLAGCAAVETRVVKVPAFTVIYTGPDEIRKIGRQYGLPQARALWIPWLNTVMVQPGDLWALGHEVGHITGDVPPDRVIGTVVP